MFVQRNALLLAKVALATVGGVAFLMSPARAAPPASEVSPAAPSTGAALASSPDKPSDTGAAWGRWYLGGHVGYAHGIGSTSFSDAVPPGLDSSFGSLWGGALVGYGLQLRSRFVLGLEADVSFPNFLDEDDLASSRQTTDGSGVETFDLLSRARGRLGYAFDRWLVYGAGGFAWSLGRFIRNSNQPQTQEESLHFRPGWTTGAGIEFTFAPRWTTRLEYIYDQFERAHAVFASGANAESTIALHSVRLALNWQMNRPEAPRENLAATSAPSNWSIHGQATYIEQGYFAFHSPYQGANSLSGASQVRNTVSATVFLGRRLWPGGEIYFNPELMQGFGLDDVHGVAAFPNGEAQKSSFRFPRFNAARLFLSQTIGLGGDKEIVGDGPNQLAGKRAVSRLTITVGKFAVLDYFLVSAYAGEPRTAFLNWNAYGGGSYDWTMDRLSWTWGGLVELNQKRWAARAGYFLLPDVSNSNTFDTRVFQRGQYTAELELRYWPFARPGKLLLFGWLSHGNMGSYSEALTSTLMVLGYPDLALTRRERTNYGFVASADQTIAAALGVFARASWSPGRVEIMGWTDCDESLSVGATLRGTRWARPNDTVGIAWVVEGLSAISRRYFAAGGKGILIGDGQLNYQPEMVLETYYAFSPVKWATLSLDYQLIADPGYNADRGPVSIFSGRLHATF
ncbi:MAG TPA: carbohydrate porin [Polyangia bacterium]|nr:carbohydrate porin [Polyangia bacterium]